jgi:hypothetical protein
MSSAQRFGQMVILGRCPSIWKHHKGVSAERAEGQDRAPCSRSFDAVSMLALRSEASESQRHFVQKVVHEKREYLCG